MKNKNDFDSVKMMRDIRDKHHKEYESEPGLREKRLAEIRKKYAHRIKSTTFSNQQSKE
jgi:hypothetical protein